jgi:hypothetical protein
MEAANRAVEAGPHMIKALKYIFAFVFLLLAITTRDTKFIEKNGFGLLTAEAVVVGFCTALSFAFVAWNRGLQGKREWLLLMSISFGVFAVLHYLFELSGFNNISADATTGAKKFKKQEEKLKKSKMARLVVGVLMFVLASFALCAWDSPWRANPPHGYGPAPPWKITGQNPWAAVNPKQPWIPGKNAAVFILEALVIGLGSAVPAIMITKDRGGDSKEVLKSFLIGIGLFGTGHFGLQYSGMYREFGFMGPKV